MGSSLSSIRLDSSPTNSTQGPAFSRCQDRSPRGSVRFRRIYEARASHCPESRVHARRVSVQFQQALALEGLGQQHGGCHFEGTPASYDLAMGSLSAMTRRAAQHSQAATRTQPAIAIATSNSTLPSSIQPAHRPRRDSSDPDRTAASRPSRASCRGADLDTHALMTGVSPGRE